MPVPKEEASPPAVFCQASSFHRVWLTGGRAGSRSKNTQFVSFQQKRFIPHARTRLTQYRRGMFVGVYVPCPSGRAGRRIWPFRSITIDDISSTFPLLGHLDCGCGPAPVSSSSHFLNVPFDITYLKPAPAVGGSNSSHLLNRPPTTYLFPTLHLAMPAAHM